AALAYLCALFSKESAVIIPLLIVLMDLYMRRRPQWRQYILLAIPSAGFIAIFLFTVSKNFMLASRSYSIGFGAIWVLGVTLHRLLWPWFYIFFALAWSKSRRGTSLVRVGCYLGV